MSNYTTTDADIDGVAAWVNGTVGDRAPEGTIAVVGAGHGLQCREALVDRENAVRLVEALTNAIEAHDAEEARKAATKLKAGDIVRGRMVSGSRYVVTSNEDDTGRADMVRLSHPLYEEGRFLPSRSAVNFERI